MSLDHLSQHPRVTVRRGGPPAPVGRCVVYWMQRSQRALDNAALDAAVLAGNLLGKPVVIFFAPIPFYPAANLRHYEFLRQGIADIAAHARARNVGFVFRPFPQHSLVRFCDEVRPALVIGDENRLREPARWREVAAKELRVPFWTVDSDVIVPTTLTEKEQYGAYTLRPRIRRLLPEFLKASGNPSAETPWRPGVEFASPPFNENFLEQWRDLDRLVSPVNTFRGGTQAALARLQHFVKKVLPNYATGRNHPEVDQTSRLSPYLHFGHIGPSTVALAVQQADAPQAAKDSFLDELITWRELAVNFVHFNPDYESFESGHAWAHRSLASHAKDERPYRYSEAQLENAATHDPLWNAAQKQMVLGGWMHNYMRMYWAKKILEWSPSPAVAYRTAVRLNDKYELDGRDPSGYAGVAWAVVGKHDRPWFDRPIFGQVRYMSYNSIVKKFDAKRYIAQVEAMERGSLFDDDDPARAGHPAASRRS